MPVRPCGRASTAARRANGPPGRPPRRRPGAGRACGTSGSRCPGRDGRWPQPGDARLLHQRASWPRRWRVVRWIRGDLRAADQVDCVSLDPLRLREGIGEAVIQGGCTRPLLRTRAQNPDERHVQHVPDWLPHPGSVCSAGHRRKRPTRPPPRRRRHPPSLATTHCRGHTHLSAAPAACTTAKPALCPARPFYVNR